MTDLKWLQIETTNRCNARCVFCVHDQFKEFGDMSDKLFEKILNDAREIDTLQGVIPMLTGESLLDPKIIPRLRMINEILPHVKINLYTNCSLLNSEIIDELAEIKNLVMFFSLNGSSRETRKRLMGLDDYDHAVEMIEMYAERTSEVSRGKNFKVVFVAHTSVTMDDMINFRDKWMDHALLIGFANFMGDKYDVSGGTLPVKSCGRAMHHMTVLYNGIVNLCCFDPFGKHRFGDLNKQTIKEVWESDGRQRFAEAHKNILSIKPCDNCTISKL